MESIYIQNDNIYEYENSIFRPQRIMKEEKKIRRVLAYFSDNLFFGGDNNGNINIYIFKNNTLKVYYNFKYILGIIKLKNNDFILYLYQLELYKLTPIF